MVKSRTVSVGELESTQGIARRLSPRVVAARNREEAIAKALGKLRPGQVVVFEPDKDEKLPTVRLSLKRVVSREPYKHLNVAGRHGALYVSADTLPFGRRGRRPKQ